MKRDGMNPSLWQTSDTYTSVSTRGARDIQDVIIVGAGITGISTALMLQKAGKICTVVEAQEIGFGTTGGTTAHLNTLLDTPYYEIEKKFCAEDAKRVAGLARTAIDLIRYNIEEFKIDCDFEVLPAYVFSKDDAQDADLKKLYESLQKVLINTSYTVKIPTPVPYRKAIEVASQAKFHPMKYVLALAKVFEEKGGMIIQNCRVTDVTKTENDILEVTTSLGKLTARAVIYATHIPPGVNMLHFTCAPYRSYAMALKLHNGNYPDGLVYDLDDPYHYYRTHEVDGQKYLIAGGADHKTGHEANTEKCFTELERYFRKFYDIEEISYKWSSQYFEPADGLPYIGHLPGNPDNVYVATGFGGNGMIYGSASAMILTDMIVMGKSEYEDLFKPARVKPMAEFSNVVKEGADVTKEMVKGWLSMEKLDELAGLAKGEGKVVKYEGSPVALYKNEDGRLFAVNPACPHIKCTVGWNSTEKSWDCPCHGSRFSYTGELLTGPARNDLDAIDLRKNEGKA